MGEVSQVVYVTRVLWVPASPLGLVGRRWVVVHHCQLCRQEVGSDDLVAHARTHGVGEAPLGTEH